MFQELRVAREQMGSSLPKGERTGKVKGALGRPLGEVATWKRSGSYGKHSNQDQASWECGESGTASLEMWHETES